MPIAYDFSGSPKTHEEIGLVLKRAVIARTLHKWLGLFVGLQILIWLATGLYMVVLDIDFIHGDPLVRNTQQAVTVPQGHLNMAILRAGYRDATDRSHMKHGI